MLRRVLNSHLGLRRQNAGLLDTILPSPPFRLRANQAPNDDPQSLTSSPPWLLNRAEPSIGSIFAQTRESDRCLRAADNLWDRPHRAALIDETCQQPQHVCRLVVGMINVQSGEGRRDR
jgi:hypothetical protein